jgi:E3 ubiquitin-protein ligase DOA10
MKKNLAIVVAGRSLSTPRNNRKNIYIKYIDGVYAHPKTFTHKHTQGKNKTLKAKKS